MTTIGVAVAVFRVGVGAIGLTSLLSVNTVSNERVSKMLKRIALLLGLAVVAPAFAHASTMSLSIVINSPASTSVTCPVTATFVAPLAAGAVVCPITVAPSTWSGTLALGGANASMFAISSGSSGAQLVVGSAAIVTPGTYAVTITATP